MNIIQKSSKNDPIAVPNQQKIVRNGPDLFFLISEAFCTSKLYPTRLLQLLIWGQFSAKMSKKYERTTKKRG